MNLSALHERAEAIRTANTPEDLFGVPCTSLGVMFKRMAAEVHPDRFANDGEALILAGAVFKRLGELHQQAEERIQLGIYGTKSAAPVPKAAFVPLEIRVGPRCYHVDRLHCQGDICDIYEGHEKTTGMALKISQHPSDNDLVENEAQVLKELNDRAKGHNHARYLPTLHGSFTLRSAATKSLRRVNVLPLYTEHISLAQVMAAFPAPGYLDFRDAAWMIKRTLEGLGFVHRQGIVHGAVLPEHVLVHPLDHGAKLIGWGSSARAGKTHVRAISTDYRHWYPPEIIAKNPATPASDCYMWARTALALTGHLAPPKKFVAFLEACLIPAPSRRPSDAWQLRDELSELLETLVGPPTYRELHMPARTSI